MTVRRMYVHHPSLAVAVACEVASNAIVADRLALVTLFLPSPAGTIAVVNRAKQIDRRLLNGRGNGVSARGLETYWHPVFVRLVKCRFLCGRRPGAFSTPPDSRRLPSASSTFPVAGRSCRKSSAGGCSGLSETACLEPDVWARSCVSGAYAPVTRP